MSGGKFEFDDGGYYVGEWKKGQACGYGVCTGPKNLGKFEGLWQSGVEVSGIYTWPNGMNYKGEWKEGHQDGFGVEQHSATKVYLGEWRNGVKHGSGVVHCGKENRPSFEGTWKNGLHDGYGIEIYKDGGYYAGQWKEGCRHGYGVRGSTAPSNLLCGSLSLRRIASNISANPRANRPATVYGMDQVFLNEKDHIRTTKEEIPTPHLMKSYSSPAQLGSINTQPSSNNLKTPDAARKKCHSVFQMMLHFRKDGEERKAEVKSEIYKGCWKHDAREGFGICYYGDGSRYVGAWKDNERHGYGLLIFKDGKKNGGKWHNDNLLLMTRRKNLRLPMIRKKINRSVLAAIEAAEKGNNKLKLAISRGLSAKKIADDARGVAMMAEHDARKAIECRRKYTLHPCLQATLTDFSRRSSNFSDLSRQDSRSDISRGRSVSNSSDTYSSRSERSTANLSTPSVVQRHSPKPSTRRKKSSLLSPFKCSSEDLGFDVMRSLDKNPAHESALYAAMDIGVGAGAMNPYISQMILMNHSDAQSRMKHAITTSKSAIANKMSSNEVFSSALLPMVMSLGDSTDGSYASQETLHTKNVSPTSKKDFLHPSDYSTKFRKFETVGVSLSIDSNSSVTSDDARMIQMKGRLLSGDDINYDYIAVSANMDGKETLVLHTDHPCPQYLADHTISEKEYINSATGLYRTVVGTVPTVLNTVKPTGIPLLDARSGSVDSGTNDDILSKEDTLQSKTEEKNIDSSSFPSVNILSSVPISYSPSFEKSGEDAYVETVRDDKSLKKLSNQVKLTDEKGNAVSILPRSSNIQQVVIHHRSHTRDLSTQTSVDDIQSLETKHKSADSINKSSGKFNISSWLTKRLWSRRGSASSIRSLSTDSGYKQSMSIDDGSATSRSFPRIYVDEADGNYIGDDQGHQGLGTTVVTIENDKFRRLRSIELEKEKTENNLHSPDRKHRSSMNDIFDQNKTIEGSPSFAKKDINLPTFFSSHTADVSLTDNTLSQECFEGYVVLGEHEEVCETTSLEVFSEKKSPSSEPSAVVTWV